MWGVDTKDTSAAVLPCTQRVHNPNYYLSIVWEWVVLLYLLVFVFERT